MKNAVFLVSLISLGCLALAFAYSKKSDCFAPERVRVFSNESNASPIPPAILSYLAQDYYFLGSGNQSFAFVSADGAYVLKLIKWSFTWDDVYLWLPSFTAWKEKQKQVASKHAQKLARVLNGFTVAAQHDAQHCGLIYAQLSPSHDPFKVQVKDKLGRKHTIDLAKSVFVLQKRAIPTGQVLSAHLEKGEVSQAKDKLSQLFAMFAEELGQGIYDNDHNIIHNTGFVDLSPIRIDFGKLAIKPEISQTDSLHQELKKLSDERIVTWMQSHYPEYAQKICLDLTH